MQVREMIRTHPRVKGSAAEEALRCIEEAHACTSGADACLAEEKVANLRQRIRLNPDCADARTATDAMASRSTGSNEIMRAAAIRLCAEACSRGAGECEKHAANA